MLKSGIEHLQSLILTRQERYLTEVLHWTMDRHLIESAFSVVEAAIRLQTKDGWKTKFISELIDKEVPTDAPTKTPASDLRSYRNRMIHDELGVVHGVEDVLKAVTAACTVVAEASCKFATAYLTYGLSLKSWPKWVDLPDRLDATITQCNRRRGNLTSVQVKDLLSSQEFLVCDMSLLTEDQHPLLQDGKLLEIRLLNVKTDPPQAKLLRVIR